MIWVSWQLHPDTHLIFLFLLIRFLLSRHFKTKPVIFIFKWHVMLLFLFWTVILVLREKQGIPVRWNNILRHVFTTDYNYTKLIPSLFYTKIICFWNNRGLFHIQKHFLNVSTFELNYKIWRYFCEFYLIITKHKNGANYVVCLFWRHFKNM